MDNLYFFKSTLNEWIIGRLTGEDENGFTLERPRILLVGPGKNKNEMMIQYPPLNILDPDGDVLINPDYVALQFPKIPQHVIDGYAQATTNIQIAHALN